MFRADFFIPRGRHPIRSGSRTRALSLLPVILIKRAYKPSEPIPPFEYSDNNLFTSEAELGSFTDSRVVVILEVKRILLTVAPVAVVEVDLFSITGDGLADTALLLVLVLADVGMEVFAGVLILNIDFVAVAANVIN